ncbi:hypothetical protein ACH5RR_006879 [Cinchona calisaya]|uniref:Uncharacterized protein n=1 Tax=Cinchona calisaya TaxID=153742 RepID=A0ABD3AQJ2_9GENT
MSNETSKWVQVKQKTQETTNEILLEKESCDVIKKKSQFYQKNSSQEAINISTIDRLSPLAQVVAPPVFHLGEVEQPQQAVITMAKTFPPKNQEDIPPTVQNSNKVDSSPLNQEPQNGEVVNLEIPDSQPLSRDFCDELAYQFPNKLRKLRIISHI